MFSLNLPSFLNSAPIRILGLGLLALLMTSMLGCSPKPSFKNVDITGSTAFGNNFSLLDTNGNTKTMADYKGKVVVLFFGLRMQTSNLSSISTGLMRFARAKTHSE